MVPVASPDGSIVPGGSALNIVRYLYSIGANPLLVSRIGDDANGREIVSLIRNSGIDASGVQIGRSQATWDTLPQKHGFCLPSGAYDSLDPAVAVSTIRKAGSSLLFQTTTAIRSETSRHALAEIQGATGVPYFVDIDLDEPWMTATEVRQVLLGAKWLRIGAAHLDTLVWTLTSLRKPELVAAAESVRCAFALEAVVAEQNGLPFLIVAEQQAVQRKQTGARAEHRYAELRDAAAAALIVAFTSDAPATSILRKVVKFALMFGGVQSYSGSDNSRSMNSAGVLAPFPWEGTVD
jgi:fructokinase